MSSNLVIQMRCRVEVNTDPQRRCYWGAHASSELVWTQWVDLESMKFMKPDTDPQERLKFWRELNDYAVSARGQSAKCEYRLATEQQIPSTLSK
jgi:hypothetical protein